MQKCLLNVVPSSDRYFLTNGMWSKELRCKSWSSVMMKTKFGLLCVELRLADMFTLADASVDKPMRATCLTETMTVNLLLRHGASKGTMTRSRNKGNKRLSTHIYVLSSES